MYYKFVAYYLFVANFLLYFAGDLKPPCKNLYEMMIFFSVRELSFL